MEFVVNDCSLHEQFPTPATFIESLRHLLALRIHIERGNRVVRCSRKLLDATVGQNLTLRQALGNISDRNLRSAIVAWLAKNGPFWDDEPLHTPDDWFSLTDGRIVTETGLGEASMAVLRGHLRAMLSFEPSDWMHSPIAVEHVTVEPSARHTITLDNHWHLSSLEDLLRDAHPDVSSWEALVEWARRECPRIVLTNDVIRWLEGHPFVLGAAERFQALLKTLDSIKGSFNEQGQLTDEGLRLHQAHFVGEKAWFSDSSDAEKRDFCKELSFRDPENPAKKIPITWHGKVKIQQMRLHFTYPIRHDRPLYVVYIGPKLTKR